MISNTELKAILENVHGANVFPHTITDVFEINKETFKETTYGDEDKAKAAAYARAKELRIGGWVVKTQKQSFEGRNVTFFLTGIKQKNNLTGLGHKSTTSVV